MTEHAEPHAALHAGALLPEELLPAKAAHEGDQLRVVALDDRAAFVEQREQVAPAAAAATLAGNLLGVQRVDQRLRPREGEPGERIEQIVQVAGARLHLAGLEQMDLVVRVSGCGRHEPYRAPGCGPEIAFLRQSVEASERAVLAQALEPGPNRVEDRVG